MSFEELSKKLDHYSRSSYGWAGTRNMVMKYWCTPEEWEIYQLFVAPEIGVESAKRIKNLDYILLISVVLLSVISVFVMYSTDGGEILFHTKNHFVKLAVFFPLMILVAFFNIKFYISWCPHTDSNREPTDYKSVALPIEL